MVEGWGKDLWRPSCPTSLAQSRFTYSRLPEAMSNHVLSINKDGGSTTFLGNLFQCLNTITVKKAFFLMFKWNFSTCVIVSGCVPGHHWEESNSLFFAPSLQVLYTLGISSPTSSLLFPRLNSTISLSLSYDRCSNPLIVFTAHCQTCSSMSISVLYWGTQSWAQHSSWVLPVLSRQEGSPPFDLSTLFS